MLENLPLAWKEALAQQQNQNYFEQLQEFVNGEYLSQQVFPPKDKIFAGLSLCAPSSVKVVILGQDPYHDVGQANGMAFSVGKGIKLPPSLVNIYKELESDLGITPSKDGDLSHWAKQGVLLLNSVLTVRAHSAASHSKQGWEEFTSAIISHLSTHYQGIVYILWGAYAQKKAAFVDRQHNLVIESAHPSPLSSYRGFFGSKPFSRANTYLLQEGKSSIDWKLPTSSTSHVEPQQMGFEF